MEKHTSGPWWVQTDKGLPFCINGKLAILAAAPLDNNQPVRLADIPDVEDGKGAVDAESLANALLISAAPQLLEALEGLLEELRLIRLKDTGAVYNPTIRLIAEQAIRVAKG
jgi:hypothetical protein